MASTVNISIQENLDAINLGISSADSVVNVSIVDGSNGRDGVDGRNGIDGRDGSDYGTTLFSISVLFETVSTFRYVAAESFRINQINNPDGLTITLEVNASPYTLGDTIEQYDELTVDVNLVGFVNLRCEEV